MAHFLWPYKLLTIITYFILLTNLDKLVIKLLLISSIKICCFRAFVWVQQNNITKLKQICLFIYPFIYKCFKKFTHVHSSVRKNIFLLYTGVQKYESTTKITKFFSRLTKSRRVKEMGFLSKICGKKYFCGQQKFSFKTDILSRWA